MFQVGDLITYVPKNKDRGIPRCGIVTKITQPFKNDKQQLHVWIHWNTGKLSEYTIGSLRRILIKKPDRWFHKTKSR